MANAETKFVPGPWVSTGEGRVSARDGMPVAYVSANRMTVGDIDGYDGMAAHTARLIAEAPALHAFVAAFVDASDFRSKHGFNGLNADQCCTLMIDARRLLSRVGKCNAEAA